MKIIFTIFLLFITSYSLQAQSMSEDTWLKVEYMQVEPADMNGFLASVEYGYKQVQKQRVKSGEIQRWHFYRVPYSGDKSKSYNFVSVIMASSLNDLQTENQLNTSEYRTALGKKKPSKHVVHTEIWNTESIVNDGVQHTPSRYKNVNYMNATTGRLDDYLNLETEIANPLHTHQMDNGRMDGWEFHRLVFPTGVETPFNFITTDFYSDLEQIEMGITRDIIREVHPQMDVDEFDEFADAIRERNYSDLWELLDYAIPE